MKIIRWIIKWLFILLVLLAILGGGVWFLFHGVQKLFHKNLIEVPSFKGLSLVEVLESRPKGLTIEIFEKKKSLLVQKGHIIEQTPKPGDHVKEGRQVLVTVSLGSDSIMIPSFVGKSVRKSNLILRNIGLNIGAKSYLESSTAVGDVVLSQSPKSGELVDKGTRVSFLLSGNFSADGRVPVLLGRSLNKGIEILNSMDIAFVKTERKNVPGYASNEILEQYPPAGNTLGDKEKVRLVVNITQEKNENKQINTKKVEINLPPGLKMQFVKIDLMDSTGSATIHEKLHKPHSSFLLDVEVRGTGYLNLFVDKVFYKKINILGDDNGIDHRANGN